MALVSSVTITVKAALNAYTQCLLAISKSTTYEGEIFREYFYCTDYNLPSVCRLLKGHISNIVETVSSVKLKLTTLDMEAVELTKRQNLHHNTAASTPTTTTAATIVVTSAVTTTTKAKTTILTALLLLLL